MSAGKSKLLVQWLSNPNVTILERINDGRYKDAAVVIRLKSGRTVAVFPFRHRDAYRGGEKSFTAARKAHVETWGISSHLLSRTRRYNPSWVVCLLWDVEEYLVSSFGDWFDINKRQTRSITSSGKQLVHLPTHLMKHVPSKKVLRGI